MTYQNKTVYRVAAGGSSSSESSLYAVRYNVGGGSGGLLAEGVKGYYDATAKQLYSDAWGENAIRIGVQADQAIANSIQPDKAGSVGRILGRYCFPIAYGEAKIAAGSNPAQPAVGEQMALQIEPVADPASQPDFFSGRIVHISDSSVSYGSYEVVTGIENSPSTATSLVLRRRDLTKLMISSEDIGMVEVNGPEIPPAASIPEGSIITGRSQLRQAPPSATYATVLINSPYQMIFDAITLRETDDLIWHGQRGVGMSFGPSNLLGEDYAEYFVDSNEVKLSLLGGKMSEYYLAEFLSYTADGKRISACVTWYDGDV